jgi:lipoyl(octanoyl) transferase
MLDVRSRFRGDVRAFVTALEQWIIAVLAHFAVKGERRKDKVGVWTQRRGGTLEEEAKIAAIGVRIRRGVSFHGLALNVAPDLDHYRSIVPCGIRDRGVTSLADLGLAHSIKDVDYCLKAVFERQFGPVAALDDPGATRMMSSPPEAPPSQSTARRDVRSPAPRDAEPGS